MVEVITLDEQFACRLLDGKSAFPPEDCGGIGEYAERVAIRKGKPVRIRGEVLRERWEWLGDWQPKVFELEEAEACVRSVGKAKGGWQPGDRQPEGERRHQASQCRSRSHDWTRLDEASRVQWIRRGRDGVNAWRAAKR